MQRINLYWNSIYLSFKSKLLVKCSWRRRSKNAKRQKPSHIVTSSLLAACSQKGCCPSFKRTPLSHFFFQALNEFTQLKVLHHFPLCVFSHGIGIYQASARAKMYRATSLLHYSIWWTPTWILLAEQTSDGSLSNSSGMLFVKQPHGICTSEHWRFHMRIKDSDSPRVGRRCQSAATSCNICWNTWGGGGAVSVCQCRRSWTGSAETENEHLALFVAGTMACQTQRWAKCIEEEVPTGLITIHFQLSALIATMICHPLVGLKQEAWWLNKEGIDCAGHHDNNCQEIACKCRWFT